MKNLLRGFSNDIGECYGTTASFYIVHILMSMILTDQAELLWVSRWQKFW